MSDQAVAPDVLRAARETHDLESSLGASPEAALSAALAAGIRANEQAVRARMADTAETWANEMSAAAEEGDEDEEGTPEFAVALSWFADKIRKGMDLNPSADYQPVAGDVVEVVVVGEIRTMGTGVLRSWSVVDDNTGLEFVFPVAEGVEPQVRVLSRAKEMSGEQEEK